MEFRDLKTQYRKIKKDVDQAITNVMSRAAFISGDEVRELEKKLAEYVGVKHCITCANGTDALTMPLMMWGYTEKTDAIFIPDFTFFATGEVIPFIGATPVFVDVEIDTYNMDPNKLEEAIESVIKKGKLTPRAIIYVDLFGQPGDFDEIKKIADKYQLKIIEDGAQGFGGSYKGQRACSLGDISTTSFFPAKPLGCYGDGGAIFTDDDNYNDILRSIAVHGKGTFKYDNVRIGWNSRLDTIQAAVLLEKLKIFKEYELTNVNLVAQKYTESLSKYVVCPVVKKGFYSSWAQYTIRLKSKNERDELQKYLKTKNIPTNVYYPKPMHTQEAFLGIDEYQDCTISKLLSETVLSLPIHPYMQDDEIKEVADAIKDFLTS